MAGTVQLTSMIFDRVSTEKHTQSIIKHGSQYLFMSHAEPYILIHGFGHT